MHTNEDLSIFYNVDMLRIMISFYTSLMILKGNKIMNSIPYTGKKIDNSNVFEEEVLKLLKDKRTDIYSNEELTQLIANAESNIDTKYKTVLDLVNSIPANQNHNLSIVKNIMTADGKAKVLTDKTNSFSNVYDDILVEKMEVKHDPRKSIISMSKLILTDRSVMTPLFTVVTDNSITRSDSTLGKLLLEVRISSPLSNFKGYITTGKLENSTGIGFFAEYSYSVDKHKMYIIAYKTTNTPNGVVNFAMIRMDEPGEVLSVYDSRLPLNISITPLIVGNPSITLIGNVDLDVVRFDQSLNKVISFPTQNSDIYGIGDLTSSNGHGPVDCKVNSFTNSNIDLSSITKIIPKYYPGNLGKIQGVTKLPVNDKLKSKLITINVQPSTFDNTTEVVGSHILKSPFGESHFDMFNLLKSIYKFVSMKPYRCFGNIIINNVVIPVIGFVVDNNIGRVTFTISPFFIVPDTLKSINGIDTQYRGLRRPLIVFDTNRTVAHSYESNGFIGDTDGDENRFLSGFDTQRKSYKKTSPYSLSLVDITVEIPDCAGLLKRSNSNLSYRYSGDYNRYNHDFTSHDYDSYPFPGLDRDISDNISELDDIPGLRLDTMILSTADNQLVFCWVDNEDEYIGYSSNANNV